MIRILKYIIGLLVLLVATFAISWVIYMPNKTERGVWLHPGNGNILDLGRLKANLYNQTSAGCTETASFPAHMGLVYLLEGAWIEANEDQIELMVNTTIERSRFNRIEALPAACTDSSDTSPYASFQMMWSAMNENYPFFDLYGVNWDERRALSPEPSEQMPDQQLFVRMKEALTGLDDGHIQLIAHDIGYFSPSLDPKWMPEPEISRIDLNQIARDTFGASLVRTEFAPIDYGLNANGIGYILIGGMWANNGIAQTEISAAQKAFAEVAVALKDAKGLVIDIRYNPGGSDGIPLTYAGHFTDEVATVIKKRTKAGAGWVDHGEASVTPVGAETQLSQPVVLLISDLTGSAAEIFTMAMREFPQVTVMGEPTGGGLSDIHGITLPNGWEFGMSNQEYRTVRDELYEGVGVPPDVLFDIDGSALSNGEDTLLEAAIEFLTN